MSRALRALCPWSPLIALSLLVGCGGSSAAPKEPPASTEAAGSAAPTASAAPAAPAPEPPASASAAKPQALPADAPPDAATLGKRFRQENPLAHVQAYVVDEACLLADKIPKQATAVQTSKIGLEDFQEGDLHVSHADTALTAEGLTDLRTFVRAFPKRRFVIFKFEPAVQELSPTWRALCLTSKPLFGGDKEIGRIRHKDGTYDEDVYRVGFADAALKRIQALPREARRLALLWDDDLLVLLPVDKLKELKAPAITLAPMEPAK